MAKRVNLGLKEALKLKAERKRKRQELADKGWLTQRIGEETTTAESNNTVEPIIAEIKKPKPPKAPEVDPKEAELIKLREQLAALQAIRELEKEEEAEVIEEVIIEEKSE